jgi:hypothetical protein
MANTSMLGLGIPMAPVTMLLGPRVTFACLLTVSLAATAAGWYVVMRRTVVRSRLAAAVAGAFCGFAPGLISHAGGQLNFVAQFLLPFIVLAVVGLSRPGHTLRRVLTLALLIIYQVFINEELLLLTAIALAVFVGVYASLQWTQVRPVAAMFVKRMAAVAGIAAVALAYPLWFQFFGPRHYEGLSYDPLRYPADLWSYVAFSTESIGGGAGAVRYTNSATEENAFFGWPLMLLCLLIGWWLWRRTLVKAAVITAGTFAVFSLGQSIVVGGKDTGIPAPFWIISRLPLGELLVPTRLSLIVVPVLALLIALGLDRAVTLPWRDAKGFPQRGIWFTAAAAALVPLIPTPLPVKELPPAPPFVSAGTWREYVAEGRTAVPVPIPYNVVMTGQTWSAETINDMAIPAGYFLGPTSDTDPQAHWGPPPRPTAELLNGIAFSGVVPPITDANRADIVDDLTFWRASVVILGDHAQARALRSALDDLLGPGVQRDGVWVWDVRPLVGAE